jgi:hypothetical protein
MAAKYIVPGGLSLFDAAEPAALCTCADIRGGGHSATVPCTMGGLSLARAMAPRRVPLGKIELQRPSFLPHLCLYSPLMTSWDGGRSDHYLNLVAQS